MLIRQKSRQTNQNGGQNYGKRFSFKAGGNWVSIFFCNIIEQGLPREEGTIHNLFIPEANYIIIQLKTKNVLLKEETKMLLEKD